MVKTVQLSDNKKVFLNICTSPEVKKFEMVKVKGGANLSLPHSVSPEREDVDKGLLSFFKNFYFLSNTLTQHVEIRLVSRMYSLTLFFDL